MNKVVIYGAKEISHVFYHEAIQSGIIEIIAFTVDKEYLTSESLFGIPVVAFEDVTSIYPPEEYDMIVLCGYGHMRNRKLMYEKAKAKNYKLINYISPDAYLESEIEMGDNNIIMSGAHIGFGGKMGSGNIIRQKVYLGHGFNMGNHNILGVNCTIGGYSTIGDLSYFGLSVTARDRSYFGNECLIGMGSNVTRPIDDYATAYGNPAKIVSYHKDTGVLVLN